MNSVIDRKGQVGSIAPKGKLDRSSKRGRQNEALDEILVRGIQSLDLTEKQHEKAVKEYQALERCLRDNQEFWERFRPDVYLQGSMDLGTCVRPIGSDEFDLDVVVVLNYSSALTIRELMDELTKVLRSFKGSHSRIERKDRCLRLNYPGDFHIDVIPARPSPTDRNPKAIKLPDCKVIRWNDSDPKSFNAYFKLSMERELVSVSLQRVDSAVNASSVAPPPKKISPTNKSVLQLVVQILKRHRDVFFRERKDGVSSAIITSLASQAYEGHQSVYDALQSVVNRMGLFVNEETPWVPNPRFLSEDYADRWGQTPPDRKAAFNEWHGVIKFLVSELTDFKLINAEKTLGPMLGERVTNFAVQDFDKEGISGLRRTGSVGFMAGGSLTPYITTPDQRVSKADNTNYFGD